jgi:predicted NBD/HSP70 family sugar kinase
MAQTILSQQNAFEKYKQEYVFMRFRENNKRMRSCHGSIIMHHADTTINRITPKVIEDAARAGDLLAQYIFWRAGYYFGIALATLIHTVNPQMIALGGSVVKAGELYLKPMRQAVREYTWPELYKACTITKAALGSTVGDKGTLSLVIQGIKK